MMHRMTWFPRLVSVIKNRTTLSISELSRTYAELGSIAKKTANRIDYHNEMAEWIGTSRMVHAKPGAAFGTPAYTSTGVYWRNKQGHPDWKADTQPKRKGLNPAKAGTPPNPGRPELGGSVEL